MNKRTVPIFLFILIFLFSTISMFAAPAQAQVNWWNATFTRRQPIEINTSTPVTDIQIKFPVTYDSDMNADFSDLRFLSNCSADATELYAWNETQTASSDIMVWVALDGISTNTTICMYYGYSDANPTWDGNNTFEFYESFDTLNNGNVVGQGGWVDGGSASDKFNVTEGAGKYEGAKSLSSISNSVNRRIYHLIPELDMGSMNIFINTNGTEYYALMSLDRNDALNLVYTRTQEALLNVQLLASYTLDSPAPNIYYKYNFTWTTDTHINFCYDNRSVSECQYDTNIANRVGVPYRVLLNNVDQVGADGVMMWDTIALANITDQTLLRFFGSEEQSITDTDPPVITILQPFNATYTNNTILFNITMNETGGECWVNYGYGNKTMTNSTGTWNYQNVSMVDGSQETIFYCNDSENNVNSTNITFTVDTTGPVISIIRPLNITYGSSDIEFNITTIETADWAAVQLLSTNHTLTNQSGQWQYFNNTLGEGTYEAKFWANDSLGNIANESIWFSIDLTPPQIIINDPINTTYDNRLRYLNWSSVDTISWAAYSLNSAANVTLGGQVTDNTEDSYTSGGDIISAASAVDEDFDTYAYTSCGGGGDKSGIVSENHTFSASWGEYLTWNARFEMWTAAGTGYAKISVFNYTDTTWYQVFYEEKFNGYRNIGLNRDVLGLGAGNPLQIRTEIHCNFFDTRYYEGQLIYNSTVFNTTFNASLGFNNLTVWANDTAGRMNRSDYVFFTVNEGINITNPLNTTYLNDFTHALEIDNRTGRQFDVMLYSLNGAANVSFNSGDIVTAALGFNHLEVWINDTAGQVYVDDVWFTVTATFALTNPDNQTYYNQLSHQLLIANGTELDVLLYSLNGGANQSASIGDLIYASLGFNTIVVWANNTIGLIFMDSVSFTTDIECINTSQVGDTLCGGDNFQHVVTCRQFGPETFQWDRFNMTFCEFGCFDGTCLDQSGSRLCRNDCLENETMCLRGNVITCELADNGCYEWNDTNAEVCQYGCIGGVCNNGTDFCTSGETKCSEDGKNVAFCDDDNGDGFYEWSISNITECEYRCQEDFNETSALWNASCSYHSFSLPEMLGERLGWFGAMVSAPFQSVGSRLAIIFITAIVAALAGALLGGKFIGIAGFFGILIFGTFTGWVAWYFTVIIMIIGGILMFKMGGDDG